MVQSFGMGPIADDLHCPPRLHMVKMMHANSLATADTYSTQKHYLPQNEQGMLQV